MPTSCRRKPNSISGSRGEIEAGGLGDEQGVGGDPLGVLARVGVARLDGVGQRPHGGHVGAVELLGQRPLLLEGVAQIGRVELELALLVGRPGPLLGELGPQLGDLRLRIGR